MSTKTTFKRIALVAVAALGLGVLSVAPSSAAVSGLTVTVTNGATTLRSGSTTLVDSDSTTAATIAISALRTAATDSITVAFYNKNSNSAGVTTYLGALDTSTSTLSQISSAGKATYVAANKLSRAAGYDSSTAGVTTFGLTGSDLGNIGATFALFLDSKTASLGKGTYTYSVVVTVASVNTGSVTTTETTQDVSIVVSPGTAASTTPSAAYSTAFLNESSGQGADSAAINASAKAGTTAGYLTVDMRNASNATGAADTITVTITGPGLVNNGTASGKSLTTYQTSLTNYSILADGNAGATTITAVATTTGQTWTKSLSFYAKSPKTITAKVNNPVLVVGSNSNAISATAVDSAGNAYTGQLYVVAVAAADALVGGSATAPVKCTWTAAKGVHYCPVTTIATGSASFKVIDQSLALGSEAAYGAAMTAASSDAVSVKVSAAPAATVKLAFDKATYAPFEKAIITVTPLDATGAAIGTGIYSNLFATGGITANQAFGSQSDTLTSVAITTSADSSSTAPRTAGAFTYVVYMPAQGTVTISATGGTSLPAAGQVAVTASATVVNASVDAATDAANEATDAANAATDAALAAADAADAATAAAQDASDAVAALSASVEKLVASLKAQLTSLTNLVIKIQKKVKA